MCEERENDGKEGGRVIRKGVKRTKLGSSLPSFRVIEQPLSVVGGQLVFAAAYKPAFGLRDDE